MPAASGTGLTFKWVKNNTDTVRTISAVTADTLTLTGVPASDNNATYKVVVSNPISQVISNSVALTVVGIVPGSAGNSFGVWTSGHSLLLHFPEGLPEFSVTVTDLWGRTVWSHVVTAGTRDITWNETAVGKQKTSSGTYVVRVALNAKPSSLLLERKVLLAH